MTGPEATHHRPIARDDPGLFAGAPGTEARMGVGPSDCGRISLEALDENPYPSTARLRDEGVVWVEADRRWLVTRWDDVTPSRRDRTPTPAMEEASLQTRVMGRTMLRSDGAAHRRLRRAAQDRAAPRDVDQLGCRFPDHADELIDGFEERGGAELMTSLRPVGGALPRRRARASPTRPRRPAVLVAGADGRDSQLRRRPGVVGVSESRPARDRRGHGRRDRHVRASSPTTP